MHSDQYVETHTLSAGFRVVRKRPEPTKAYFRILTAFCLQRVLVSSDSPRNENPLAEKL